MKILQPTFFFILSTVSLMASAQKDISNQRLIGNWVNSESGFEMTILLEEDGTGSFEGEELTYDLKKQTLTVTLGLHQVTYNFERNGDALKLSGGDMEGWVLFNRRIEPEKSE